MKDRLVRAVPVRLGGRGDGGSAAAPDRGADGRSAGWTGEPFRTACAAPSIQLRFDPNGLVTTCCKTVQPLGHIARDRLRDIWDGALRHQMEDALAVDDFSVGCQRCGAEIAQEGREVSYAAIHDEWSGHLTDDPATRAWPVRFEFNLSNSCNLQCIQCDGESSSMIRLHREGRPPLPAVYGDQFFDDLLEFLPHLDRIVFAGGEPFLAPENFRVWDLIAEHAPHIDCMVVTNATQRTPRIEALLERLRFSFVFSLDGITAPTYEAIRIGSDFEQVMANVDHFTAYTREVGTTASVNHCLMPQNAHEFGDLLVWAEERGLFVNVSVVRTPAHASIARLPLPEIERISALLESQNGDVRSRLSLNLGTWDGELARLGSWAEGQGEAAPESHTVMFFRCQGAGPVDDAAARAELAAVAADGDVHRFAIGSDDRVRWVDARFAPGLEELIGRSYQDLTGAVTAMFGEMIHYEVVATGDDRIDAHATFGSTPARITYVPMRNDAGWADDVHLLLAFEQRSTEPEI
jgi:MoaA/NifB/PqqE/SkfB family radical SAM enzyme